MSIIGESVDALDLISRHGHAWRAMHASDSGDQSAIRMSRIQAAGYIVLEGAFLRDRMLSLKKHKTNCWRQARDPYRTIEIHLVAKFCLR